MAVKRQISSLWKLYSIYGETPGIFLDEMDVDSHFYQNIFDISQSQRRIARVSKIFAIKFFYFCNPKTQQRYNRQTGVINANRELSPLVDSLRVFLKIFDKASKCLQSPLPKPKNELGSKMSKDNLFAEYCKDIFQHAFRLNRLSFQIQNNNSGAFSVIKFVLHGNQVLFTEIVDFNHRQNRHLYKNRK